jgi:hypothetical protein
MTATAQAQHAQGRRAAAARVERHGCSASHRSHAEQLLRRATRLLETAWHWGGPEGCLHWSVPWTWRDTWINLDIGNTWINLDTGNTWINLGIGNTWLNLDIGCLGLGATQQVDWLRHAGPSI